MSNNTAVQYEELGQKTRAAVQSVVVAAAYAKAAQGESVKAVGLNKALHAHYHGDSSSGIPSQVDAFIAMNGDLFGSFIDKGLAEECSEGDGKTIRLDLGKFMRWPGVYMKLNTNVQTVLHMATFSSPTLLAGSTLMRIHKNNMADVRKFCAHEKKFMGPDGNFPSGQGLEDLFNHIWENCWKAECAGKKKKSAKASTQKSKQPISKKAGNESDDESDEFEDATSQQPTGEDDGNDDGDEGYPKLKYDGKFMPRSWAVYLCFVCSHSFCTDKLVNMFVGDGKLLDSSSARPRYKEREKIKKGNATKRKFDLGNGDPRGVTIDQQQLSIQLALKVSREDCDRLSDSVTSCHMDISQMAKMRGDNLTFLAAMYPGDPQGMRSDALWHEVTEMNVALQATKLRLKNAQEKLILFEATGDMMGHKSKTILQTLPGFSTKGSLNSPPIRTIKGGTTRGSPISAFSGEEETGREAAESVAAVSAAAAAMAASVAAHNFSKEGDLGGIPYTHEELYPDPDETVEKGIRSLHNELSDFIRNEMGVSQDRASSVLPTVDDIAKVFGITTNVRFTNLIRDLKATSLKVLWPENDVAPDSKEGRGWSAAQRVTK